jgi:hypothetical protein
MNGDKTVVYKFIHQAAIVGAALLGISGTAYAGAYTGATHTIDGITFPVGIAPDGNQIHSGLLEESQILAVGDVLRGVGSVSSIGFGLDKSWADGTNNLTLAFVIEGYVARSIVLPSVPKGDAFINFTGGLVSFYDLNSATDYTLGNIDLDIATVKTGTLFLQLAGSPANDLGDTLLSTTPGGSLAFFKGGSGVGFLDVIGGDAAAAFATQTFVNPNSPTGYSDLSLTSDYSTSSTDPEFAVSGSATLKANAIPEPFSLAVLGIGLVAVGAVRRRRR